MSRENQGEEMLMVEKGKVQVPYVNKTKKKNKKKVPYVKTSGY